MKNAVVIGSGISGMTCAVKLAEKGVSVTLVSPFPSERSQSVMAAGGINAVLPDNGEGDSVALHIEETLSGGGMLAGIAVCAAAPLAVGGAVYGLYKWLKD